MHKRDIPIPGQDPPDEDFYGPNTGYTKIEDNPAEEPESVNFARLGREAYEDSTTYFDIRLRERLEKNYSLAASRHPSGSKYYTDKYKYRSKVFRGKTQSAIMRNLASATIALFSTDDVISIKPERDDNDKQRMAAEGINEILNYRFVNNVKWFQSCIGAFSEAQTAGFVCSKNYWSYVEGPDIDDDTHEWGDDGVPVKPIKDDPVIELIPPENIRLHPSCDWMDPINSSPYVIILYPMYVADVRERMEKDWTPASESQIIAAGDMASDSVRMARDGEAKVDEKDQSSTIRDFDVVWIREIFMNVEGVELVYYMLGDNHMLTEPALLSEVYPHCTEGKRPFSWGVCSIDPHKPFSVGLPERVEGSQVQANEIANQRFDNVQQVLNKRFIANRNANIDFRSLMQNVPGSITLSDDINGVQSLDTNDVTSSSYQEQAMINMDFDEIAGAFSNSSVGTNRQLNETVGGMQLMAGSANALTEYQLRIFVETWGEDVIKQCVKMIQTYEGNETIQSIVGGDLNSAKINENVLVRVNVGFGATDPQQRIGRLMMGLSSIAKVSPDYMQKLDMKQVVKEVFGAVGYRDGDRFFNQEEEQMIPASQAKQLIDKMQELQHIIDTKQIEQQGKLEAEKIKGAANMQQAQLKEQAETQRKVMDLSMEKEIKSADMQQRGSTESRQYLLDTMDALNRKIMALNQSRELNYKINTGNQGI